MSAIKRVIRRFYRLVHPDLMAGSAQEAVACNSKALQELNSYIDRLESSDNVKAPFVGRTINLFKPMINRKGEIIRASLRPCSVTLPSISPGADMLEKENLSVDLIRQIEAAMGREELFSSKSSETQEIEPIVRSSPSNRSARSELQKVWKNEALRSEIKDSIYSSIDERMSQYREYQSIQIYNKLFKKYSKMKNAKRRAKRMSSIESEVEDALKHKNISSSLDAVDTSPDAEIKIRIIESGFHPDLVFFASDLTEDQKETGIGQVCGVNLTSEADSWLLENVWRAVRKDRSPPVPIVLTTSGFKADVQGGFLEIPFDFLLSDLVDFLEDNLEDVREARKQLLANFIAVYAN
jgi:hypothetical protein